MSIHAVCPECETDYRLKAEAAGRQIRCKICDAVFRVPRRRGAAPVPPDGSGGGRRSTAAGQRMVSKPKRESAPELPPRLPPRVKSLTGRSERSERRRPVESPRPRTRRRRRSAPRVSLPSFGLETGATLLFGSLGLVSFGALFSPNFVMTFGLGWVLIGLVTYLTGVVMGIIVAFQEDVVCGLAYMFIPCFCWYYILTRWDEMCVPFCTALLGFGIMTAGGPLAEFLNELVR